MVINPCEQSFSRELYMVNNYVDQLMLLFHIVLITLACLPILSTILSFSNFIHTFSVFISFQTVISDIDILDILDVVPFPSLGDLYSRLSLTPTQVTNARLEGRTAREQEKTVLVLWRNINDKAATRDVILKAMSKDTWKEWKNTLRKEWGYPEV